MAHTPHELSEEFPGEQDVIRSLKMSNEHFYKLADAYHEINREVHRIESNIQPASDLVLEDLKKQRLSLKDQISEMIRNK